MRVRLAYGRSGLTIDVPRERTTVIEPIQAPALADPDAALTAALRRPVAGPPLRGLAKPGQTLAISVCDVTRAQPRREMVGAVLRELDGIVRPEDVMILIATGTHRANTPAELRAMLGDEIISSCRVINHDARDDSSLVELGESGNGVPTRLCRHWLEADLRITTGFVEPHFFAGFSGGPKMVAPGLAGLDTVLTLHDAARVGDPRSTWGIIEKNPLHSDIRAIAARPEAEPHFSMDVLLDRSQRITHVFAGELFAMHRRACAAAKPIAMRETSRRFEVVVTTNSGYPLDQNLYQAVKGMSAAAQVVVDGGLRGGAGPRRRARRVRGGTPRRAHLRAPRGPADDSVRCGVRRKGLPDVGEARDFSARPPSAAKRLADSEFGPSPHLPGRQCRGPHFVSFCDAAS